MAGSLQADPATVERALAAIDAERVSRLLCRLVDTPSPTGSERACAEVLAEHLAQAPVRVELQAFHGTRANVLASLPQAGTDGIRLMLCGHLDTGGYGDPAEDYPTLGPLWRARSSPTASCRGLAPST
jgi:acetylornithine deacetylase/succinyl-diaminopimelate desuccinylase-like protein